MKRLISNICLGCFGNLDSHRFCFRCRKRADDRLRSPSHLAPRTILNGKYIVGHNLGQGGFGITYTGWDIETETKVAIKEFFPKLFAARSPDRLTVLPQGRDHVEPFERYREMFISEVQLLEQASRLPGIVKILDFFGDNNTFYMVMEYLNGLSMRDYINQYGGRISFNHAISVLLPVMESLKVLHQMGMIHRDISPENIYISDKQFVKLIDFGAAIIYNHPDQKQLTQLKEGFAPLEQYSTNIQQGPWTDIYQLAATIYASTTGMIPYSSPLRAARDMQLPITYFGVSCAPVQEHAIFKGMAINISDRYHTMGEFMENLYGPTLLMKYSDDELNTNPFQVGPNPDNY